MFLFFFICFDYDEDLIVRQTFDTSSVVFPFDIRVPRIYRSSLVIYSHHSLGDSDDNHADYQSTAGTTISCLREQ